MGSLVLQFLSPKYVTLLSQLCSCVEFVDKYEGFKKLRQVELKQNACCLGLIVPQSPYREKVWAEEAKPHFQQARVSPHILNRVSFPATPTVSIPKLCGHQVSICWPLVQEPPSHAHRIYHSIRSRCWVPSGLGLCLNCILEGKIFRKRNFSSKSVAVWSSSTALWRVWSHPVAAEKPHPCPFCPRWQCCWPHVSAVWLPRKAWEPEDGA